MSECDTLLKQKRTRPEYCCNGYTKLLEQVPAPIRIWELR